MTWDNMKFTGRDVILIIGQVVVGTAFILIMRGDINKLVEGQSRMENKQDKSDQKQETLRAKTEVEITELKVRISLLEQKVADLQIQRDAKSY